LLKSISSVREVSGFGSAVDVVDSKPESEIRWFGKRNLAVVEPFLSDQDFEVVTSVINCQNVNVLAFKVLQHDIADEPEV
jgi:hypothetical protein